MADNLSIARPYAKAIFAEASLSGELEGWLEVLETLRLISRDSEMSEMLKNPKILAEQLTDLFLDLTETLLVKLKSEMIGSLRNFLRLLSLEKRLILLPEIAVIYEELLAEQEELMKVQVISTADLDQATQSKLQRQLEEKFKSKVEIEYHLDPSLLGGAIIKTASWVMDGSVKGKLAKLKDSL